MEYEFSCQAEYQDFLAAKEAASEALSKLGCVPNETESVWAFGPHRISLIWDAGLWARVDDRCHDRWSGWWEERVTVLMDDLLEDFEEVIYNLG